MSGKPSSQVEKRNNPPEGEGERRATTTVSRDSTRDSGFGSARSSRVSVTSALSTPEVPEEGIVILDETDSVFSNVQDTAGQDTRTPEEAPGFRDSQGTIWNSEGIYSIPLKTLTVAMKVQIDTSGGASEPTKTGDAESSWYHDQGIHHVSEDIPSFEKSFENVGVCLTLKDIKTGSIIISLVPKDVESLRKLVEAYRSGELRETLEKSLISEKMREAAKREGKKLTLEVTINEPDILGMIELMEKLNEAEGAEGDTGITELWFTYCAALKMWFWTPYEQKHIWMKVNHKSVLSGPKFGGQPSAKNLKLLAYLQERNPQFPGHHVDCVICDLRRKGRVTYEKSSSSETDHAEAGEPETESGTKRKHAAAAKSEDIQQLPNGFHHEVDS
ncbi:uncharacterized protein LOC106181845 [Lingula anatina]|uniref:Uncharacterized protein LOC106181845 n=1 Tax=Lingula anatina TaxID=7574 RepID=A0A1S3KH41_LINAN|nr:uncharacterized protein LOC106181845 [Lingula anatina]|eukprot:XP_013421807.1 uncharacterized protein LOC106181845 [Lingula anatina]